MKANQSQNQHLLAFDPVYPKNLSVVNHNKDNREEDGLFAKFKPTRYMRMIHYGGTDEEFETVDGVIYNVDGSATLEFFAPNAKLVQVLSFTQLQNSSPEYRKDKQFYSKDYTIDDMKLCEDGYWRHTINPCWLSFNFLYCRWSSND